MDEKFATGLYLFFASLRVADDVQEALGILVTVQMSFFNI